ncbi:hypothetical protein SCLCIDRAFT_634363 [Scleroderma citrinum Foug A]|uniref:Uncharacterized protein n=1 Tax=Scleroderma citrinum Foug A TaxID=1036808 RepID=A0A0C3E980_9AGAM|nr:hypothetical protein SCLCIDRAFT_634363 [Scleroderma citrinum Foug A]
MTTCHVTSGCVHSWGDRGINGDRGVSAGVACLWSWVSMLVIVVPTVPHSRRARGCRARACYSNCCDHCGDRRGYGQRCRCMAIVVVVTAVSRSP